VLSALEDRILTQLERDTTSLRKDLRKSLDTLTAPPSLQELAAKYQQSMELVRSGKGQRREVITANLREVELALN
jgi:hypothetical protein